MGGMGSHFRPGDGHRQWEAIFGPVSLAPKKEDHIGLPAWQSSESQQHAGVPLNKLTLAHYL